MSTNCTWSSSAGRPPAVGGVVAEGPATPGAGGVGDDFECPAHPVSASSAVSTARGVILGAGTVLNGRDMGEFFTMHCRWKRAPGRIMGNAFARCREQE